MLFFLSDAALLVKGNDDNAIELAPILIDLINDLLFL
jgi:hypothetical protein